MCVVTSFILLFSPLIVLLVTESKREDENTKEIALNADDFVTLNQEQYITTDPPNLNSDFEVKKKQKQSYHHSCSIEDKLLRRWMLEHSGSEITGKILYSLEISLIFIQTLLYNHF